MFENLAVYQRSITFITEITTLINSFPRGYSYLTDQLGRASLSIATNLAEGSGRFTKPDRRNFFTITRGSVQECVPLLEVAAKRELISEEIHVALRAQLEEIARMISGLLKPLRAEKW